MPDNKPIRAVAYCRVSSARQKTEGAGLGSQATRCREYCKFRGLVLEEIFKDYSSGSLIDRPGMKAMLAYLRKQPGEPYVVVIEDISRLARGLDAHLALRAAISRTGATLESPTLEFGSDSDSLLVENLLASVNQREKNGGQVRNRMRTRLLEEEE